ncbi:MAG: hypothetical protein NT076_04265 [Candidatus Pacearchaeota archaeon]|nr:hypothetical protein [Candidatus Pacearchaeota archaeon]
MKRGRNVIYLFFDESNNAPSVRNGKIDWPEIDVGIASNLLGDCRRTTASFRDSLEFIKSFLTFRKRKGPPRRYWGFVNINPNQVPNGLHHLAVASYSLVPGLTKKFSEPDELRFHFDGKLDGNSRDFIHYYCSKTFPQLDPGKIHFRAHRKTFSTMQPLALKVADAKAHLIYEGSMREMAENPQKISFSVDDFLRDYFQRFESGERDFAHRK